MKKEDLIKAILVFTIVILLFVLGIKPIIKGNFSLQSGRQEEWPKDKLSNQKDVYDVIVVGEEPEGIAAAVSAARVGARTLLIAQGDDLGGSVSQCLNVDMEASFGTKGDILNRGIFFELSDNMRGDYSTGHYKEIVRELVEHEKNLEVVYGTEIDSPVLEGDMITGINTLCKGEKKVYKGKRIIDATKEGKILALSSVPYSTGSEDLNLQYNFLPVRLNFEVEGISYSKLKGLFISTDDQLTAKIKGYRPSKLNMRVMNLNAVDQKNGKLVVSGLEATHINVMDKNAVDQAYQDAVEEAKTFVSYLGNGIEEFKGIKFSGAAEKFCMSSPVHFQGEYILGVNDVLGNKNFFDKISVGSNAVRMNVNGGDEYIIGKPTQYGIPLGCIIPLKADNLLMVGDKASYSSLAASSAGSTSVSITEGQSAGIIAVYSIIKGLTPREILKKRDISDAEDFKSRLKKQGVYLPDFDIKDKNAGQWSYSELKKLINLGLISGGIKNDYAFQKEATEEDLTYLLINGIYRISDDKYSLELDSRMEPYFVKNKLTKDKLGEILCVLHGTKNNTEKTYEKACARGYIDKVAQLRLRDKKSLTMDDVYYLSSRNIRLFTGKDLPD